MPLSLSSINTRVTLWFSLTCVLLCAITFAIYSSFAEYRRSNDWIAHTYEVIGQVDTVLSDLNDAHAAIRGYLLFNQEVFLGRYDISLPEIRQSLDKLTILIADNPVQVKNTQNLRARVDVLLAGAATIIKTNREISTAAATELLHGGTSTREMVEVRKIVADMEKEELRLLSKRQSSAEQAANLTVLASGLGLLLCGGILLLVFAQMRREALQREASARSLADNLIHTQNLMEQTQAINKMGDYLQNCRDLQEAYTVLATHMPRLLPNTAGLIGVFSNSRNLINSVLQWGDHQTGIMEFVSDDCWALRSGRSHFAVIDGGEPLCKHFHSTSLGGALCVPMQAHGETHGVLCIQTDDPAIISTNQELIRAISEQASLTFANLRLQEKLQLQSVSDPLTKLFNRRYLEATFERELSRARRYKQPLSVLMLDVDHFKHFNDTWGHDAGDALLAGFAEMLQQNVRKEDVVCRFGGEEFIILLPNSNLADTEKRAQLLVEKTRELQVALKGRTLDQVTVSIGAASLFQHGETTEELITAADAALYAAKHAGRDQLRLAPTISAVA